MIDENLSCKEIRIFAMSKDEPRFENKTYSYITTSSNGNWKKCLDLMKRLLDDDRVTNAKRAEWSKLSLVMSTVFGNIE